MEELKIKREIISGVAKDTIDVLDNLIKTLQIQVNSISVITEEVDMNGLIRESIEAYKSKIKLKKLNLRLNIDYNAIVLTDKNIMGSIIRNLLLNSIYCAKEEGIIFLECFVDKNKISFSISGCKLNNEINFHKSNFSLEDCVIDSECRVASNLKLIKKLIDKLAGEYSFIQDDVIGKVVKISIPHLERLPKYR